MNTWNSYKNWVEQNVDVLDAFMFRGQSDSRWPLETSFHRIGLRTEDMDIYFDTVLQKMGELVESVDPRSRNLDDPFERASFVSLLQHSGLPTPHLDWTFSPYVAAYFAFSKTFDPDYSGESINIYCFWQSQWQKDFKQQLDYKIKTEHVSVIHPKAMGNIKLLKQQGLFMFTNVKDIEAHINLNSKQRDAPYLTKFQMSISERSKILKDLNLMGITAMSLFPTLEGICQYGKEEIARVIKDL